jgi:protein-S-isoprenylcysteine O-methyltransferase Ste14
MNLKHVSIGATAILTVAVLSLLLRHSLFTHRPLFLGIQALAAAIMLWARITFGARSFHAGANPTAGGLVTSGPYRFVRHPIYTAILVFVWAGVASHGTNLSVLAAIVATAAVMVRVVSEEELVEVDYPEYVEYAKHTKRIIPFVL